jgi:ATP-dependent helicase/nuclease subunit B
MLQVWEIENRQSINDWLDKLDISKQTWLLSDLRTKFEIQDLYIQKRGFFLEESVLRISDLWKRVLLRSHPDYKVITQQAALLHLRSFLRMHGKAIDLPESSENTLLNWLSDLAPLYFQSDAEEKLREWFLQNPDQSQSWNDWWLRVKATFSYFQSKKLLIAQWIPAFLQSLEDISLFWDKDLFVDLSSQISFVEAELLKQISQKQEVTVLTPVLLNSSKSKYSDLLQPYEYLKGFAHNIQAPQTNSKNSLIQSIRNYSSFSSTLGTLRQATAQVRHWIEQGVSLDQIAIVAPDIEAIWSVLSFHLETEGIPANKSNLNSFQGTVGAQYFLAKLRSMNFNLSTRDLELSYFSAKDQSEDQIEIGFEKFEAFYKNIYDEYDYARFDKMRQILNVDIDLKIPINQNQFIFQIAKINVGEVIPSWLEVLIRDLLSSFDESFLLPWADWISFCESCLSRNEVLEKQAAQNGIMVTNIIAAHFLKVTHRVFLELNEENLKAKSDRGIMPMSARKISKDLGFWLNHPEQGDLEFELEWAIQCGMTEDVLYYGAVNLSGQIMTPSSVWLKAKSRDYESTEHAPYQIPEITVLDGLLQSHSDLLNPNFADQDSSRLLQDVGLKVIAPIEPQKLKHLSPSALESFQKCPFIYFARQTLGLKTFPEIDLDLDRRTAGEALHYLFEVILTKGIGHWTEAELDLLLEETKKSHFAGVIEGLWQAQKKKILKICIKFVQFEKDWRSENSKIKDTQTEVNWEGPIEGIKFRGRIDRVDISEKNELVVIDYKLTGNQLKGAHQWIENGSLQMLFYIYALENGWAKGIEGEVVAAFYFVIKNFSRETGFELDQEIPGFFKNTKKRNQKFSVEKKIGLISEFEGVVKSLTGRLQSGEMNPQPADEKLCDKCDWRRLCRAPHLA